MGVCRGKVCWRGGHVVMGCTQHGYGRVFSPRVSGIVQYGSGGQNRGGDGGEIMGGELHGTEGES